MWGELEGPTVGRQQASPEPRDVGIWAGQLLGPAWEQLWEDQLTQNLMTLSRQEHSRPRTSTLGSGGSLEVDPAASPRFPP